jgi:hypothetical protein
MKIRLLTMYNGIQAGTVIDPGAGVAALLIQRKIAEIVNDADNDGREEGGPQGTKKAFTAPPTVGFKGKRR